jgi:hypothetical protein
MVAIPLLKQDLLFQILRSYVASCNCAVSLVLSSGLGSGGLESAQVETINA